MQRCCICAACSNKELPDHIKWLCWLKHFVRPLPACLLSIASTPALQVLFKGPADVAVEEVHAVLRSIVASSINSDECKSLVQYTGLKRDIVQTAGAALGKGARACVDLNGVHSQGRPGSG